MAAAAAAAEQDESVNSVSDAEDDDEQTEQLNQAEKLPEHPWPYLASMFEFSGVKKHIGSNAYCVHRKQTTSLLSTTPRPT